MDVPTDSYQAGFARRWGHLRRAHVRALAWLLDAPDLLDAHDPHWEGRVATLGPVTPATADWLARLDADPAPLDAALGVRVHTRLGLYAEGLMAFYFAQQGSLLAHGLQVRAGRTQTIGEFDFLLKDGDGDDAALHIEFATKFYLLQPDIGGTPAAGFDSFVGPNLADSLGRKMRKVFERQLVLGAHPAALEVLPRPVSRAQALVKGWLFYPAGSWQAMQGIATAHCRGFWCRFAEIDTLAGERFLVLPKLAWLAPFQAQSPVAVLDRAQLKDALAAQFAQGGTPALVALLREEPDTILEVARGFIVPSDWGRQA